MKLAISSRLATSFIGDNKSKPDKKEMFHDNELFIEHTL